jgi:kinesin family protein 2/24
VDLIPFAWDGGIGTLFAYGQTGSGKTFTTSRLQQLVCETLLEGDLVGSREVYITIIDLAGNSAFDLLNSRAPIAIQEDSLGVTQLTGVHELLVEGRDEMISLIDRATSFRRTAPTAQNDASSRSHGICRIRISNPLTNSHGLLYLVDLAGSEAARDIAVHGADRMRETREINTSLSVLKDCIRGKMKADALKFLAGAKSKQKKPPHIPFRQSALTKILKHVFDPNGKRACKTVVIACVNPSLADVGPSKNTLRYAEMLRVVVPLPNNVSAPNGSEEIAGGLSSVDDSAAGVPFKERIRPGMIVSWRDPAIPRTNVDTPNSPQFAAILCPAEVVEQVGNSDLGNIEGIGESEHHGNDAIDIAVCTSYLCAIITLGKDVKSHELNLWRQVVINVDSMDEEIILRYDSETRYYYVVEPKVE